MIACSVALRPPRSVIAYKCEGAIEPNVFLTNSGKLELAIAAASRFELITYWSHS